jgi:pimeloyl-ACP methyl ester carboxylesterase
MTTTQSVEHRMTATGPRAELLAGMTIADRRIVAAGISTAVLEIGSGSDIVVLHGPGEFGAGWCEVLPGLSVSHHVVAPDLPGHGESGTDGDLDGERVLAWLDDVIAATCPSRPLVIGRVLGGAIAMRYGVTHGDRISGLVLVDTLGLATFDPTPPFGEALHRFLAEPTALTHERVMQYCAHDFQDLRRRLGDRWAAYTDYAVDRLRRPTTQAATGMLMAEFGMAEIPENTLARISVPTTLIWGRHDLATPLRVAEAASRAFGWPLHVVEDAADDPALEQPEAFLAVLRTAISEGVQR